MRVLTIASGSSGNCIYVGDEQTHILIDCGISKKKIVEGLNSIGLTGSDIDALFVTHEHSDHISGLGVLSRAVGLPVFTTEGTKKEIDKTAQLGRLESSFGIIKADEEITLGTLKITPFSTSHDAAESVGFRVESGSKSFVLATDLGVYSEYTERYLREADTVLVEANHDVRMLEMGRYPYYLKQRILSDKGHLSNEAAGHLINDVLHDDLKHIILGHLSAENNYPALAYESVCAEITMSPNEYKAKDFDILVAKRDVPGELLEW